MVASDGGFLKSPVGLEQVILSPGERAEVIADFSRAGTEKVALIAESNGGQIYRAMEFRLSGARMTAWVPPDTLVPVEAIPASEATVTRNFTLSSGMGGRMTINGRTMSMNRIDERVKLGTTEIWDISNGSGGGMMGGMMNQPHSFHLHAVQFQILDINGRSPPPELSGWKDTVLLWPGDRVRIIARFDSYKGLFMYHCHLLEHEDNGMMGQFLIE
jgi:FtsP/CotA-like multicopper oxidase with cupredoxin domain